MDRICARICVLVCVCVHVVVPVGPTLTHTHSLSYKFRVVLHYTSQLFDRLKVLVKIARPNDLSGDCFAVTVFT